LVETAVLRALVPNELIRRSFLKVVGAATALAAIAEVFPLATAKAIAQGGRALEKTRLNIGFIPITCTVPLLLAHALGEYQKEGIEVSLCHKATSRITPLPWALLQSSVAEW
jgi:nitrate/nitrite transport system substrate-binding protein